MAGQNATGTTRFFGVRDLGLQPNDFTGGTWTVAASSNIWRANKAAAATTSVIHLPVPRSPRGFTAEDYAPASIACFYSVATAALSSAPTAVLNLITAPTATGTVARSAVTQTIAFSGLDSVGTATGDHIATVSITTPAVLLDTDHLYLALTMNEAATSVLNFFGIRVTYS